MKSQKSTPKVKEKQSNVHKCALCPYASTKISNFKTHVKVHSSEKPFKCPECPYRAKLKHHVKLHLTSVHLLRSSSEIPRPFPCPHLGCSYAAKEKSTLTQHSKVHSDEKSFFCSHPNCNYSTKQKLRLIEHNRIHTGEKPFVCQFESCSFAATTQRQLETHTKTHSKERPFKCPEGNCAFSTAHIQNLKHHQINHRSKEAKEYPSFQCPLCEYTSMQNSNLSRHITQNHTFEKPFKCDEPNCNFEAKTKAQVKTHKVVHSDEKPLKCSFESCEYRCKFKYVLENHLQTHSEEQRYKCELCPFRGKQRSVVSNHIKTVHSDPDFRPFKCTHSQCDYAAKSKANLLQHLLIHKGEKKYSCPFPLCEYRAIMPKSVKNHQKFVHETEKKFKCRLCHFATKTNGHLISHMRTHTKETPYLCKEEGCEYRAKHIMNLRKHQETKHPQSSN